MRSESAYFYDADGSQVPLGPSDEVAVQWKAADAANLPASVLAELKGQGRDLRQGVSMLPSAAVSDDVAQALDKAGALQPVYRSVDGALVVVLPEVRIELADTAQGKELRAYLESFELGSEVLRDTGEQVVLRPTSNRGDDALNLANAIEEAVHPPLSQARFVRIVPRPGT